MPEELSVSREDYLKAIIEAQSEGRDVVPVLLAEWLDVSPPAVSKAIRRLREDGYVESNGEGTLGLTAKGRAAAEKTALRHHLVERMLSEIFGMEWHKIHAEAERLEHVISPEFERKLIEKLGTAGDCPHGNGVLPETPAQLKKRGLVSLAEAEEDQAYVVARLYERDTKLLEFFHKLKIGPAVTLRLIERNYDGTYVLEVAGDRVTLGESAAGKLWLKSAAARRKN